MNTSEPNSVSFHPKIGQKRRYNYSETLWPKRICKGDCNTIFASEENNWSTVEHVKIGKKRYKYIQYINCDYELSLCHNAFTIQYDNNRINLPCIVVQASLVVKARFLSKHVREFPNVDSPGEIQ